VAESVRAFGMLATAWIRSSMAYRTSFVTLTVSNAALTFLDFVIVLIIFSHLDAFGGFTLAQLAVLYGMSGLAIGIADLVLGNAEMLGQRVRDGSLDQMMCRPVPTLVRWPPTGSPFAGWGGSCRPPRCWCGRCRLRTSTGIRNGCW
jgi:ABC-2 type transport system permease protein